MDNILSIYLFIRIDINIYCMFFLFGLKLVEKKLIVFVCDFLKMVGCEVGC